MTFLPRGAARFTVASALAVSFAVIGRGETGGDGTTEDRGAIRRSIEASTAKWRESAPFPGVSVAVAFADGEVIAVAAGARSKPLDGESSAAATLEPKDRFLAGSVGKTFVAALALVQWREGRLALDDLAVDLLDDGAWLRRVPNGAEVTVRQLLSHRSGIPRYVLDPSLWAELLAEPDRAVGPEECLARLEDVPPLFAPDEGWSYSDSNYLVLGRVLEATGGAPFYEQVRDRFLRPLELDGIIPQDRRRIDRLVHGYPVVTRDLGVPEVMLDDEGRLPFHPGFEWCGGGFATTPTDLSRWTHALFSGGVIGADALAEMLRDPADARPLGRGTRYGLGVILRDTELGEMRGHDGIFPGYLCATAYFPELQIAVTAQWNTDGPIGGPPHRFLVELARIVRDAREP